MRRSRAFKLLIRLYRLISPSHHPLEKRLYNFLTVLGAVASLVFVFPANLIQNIFWVHNLFVLFLGLFCLGLFVLSHRQGLTLPGTLATIGLIVFSLLFLTSGGQQGGLGFYFCFALLYTIVLLRGPQRLVFSFLYLVTYPILVWVTGVHPEWVTPFVTSQDQTAHFVTGYCVSASMAGFLLWTVMSDFDLERYRVNKRSRVLRSLVNELKDLTIKDGLTNIYNHKYLFERLEEEVASAQRHGQPLSLILFDIDFFKSINDTHGHPTGDKVLIRLAEVVKRALRKSDVFGRYGGEEFLVILTNTNLEGSVQVAEKIRRLINETDLLDSGLRISVSLGVAEYSGEPAIELVDRTDKYLYQAKKHGRNRVEFPLA